MVEELLNLEKTKVKPGLEGKIILLSGSEKCGKTTFCSQLPDSLLIALEPGYNMLSGIQVKPCDSWVEFKKIVKALKDEKLREKFKFISIDTIGILWTLCAKFVWAQKNDPSLEVSDFEIGTKQNACMVEFSNAIMDIAKCGYGLVMVSHIASKDMPNELGYRYGNQIICDIPKRPRSFLQGLCDLTITVVSQKGDNGATVPYMYLRECIENGILISAGGRYKDLPEKAIFSYENLVNIIEDADKKLAESGADMSGTKTSIQETIKDPTEREWTEIVKDVNDTLKRVSEKGNAGDREIAGKVKAIIASYLGENKKITEAVPSQSELVEAALADIKALVA